VSREPIIVDNRRGVHFNISRDAYAAIRILCFKKHVSSQEVLEEIAQLIASEHPFMLELIDGLAERKRTKQLRKLTQYDAESLFSIIADENPLSSKKSER
jgi:hypothetical protein